MSTLSLYTKVPFGVMPYDEVVVQCTHGSLGKVIATTSIATDKEFRLDGCERCLGYAEGYVSALKEHHLGLWGSDVQ